jgi:hypothetical protein
MDESTHTDTTAPTNPKPGEKGHRFAIRGGKPKGAIALTARLSEEERQAIAKRQGITPLEFLVSVLREPDWGIEEVPILDRDGNDTGETERMEVGVTMKVKMDAAKAALPYMHKRMPIAIEGGDKPLAVFDMSALRGLSTPEIEALMTLLDKVGTSSAVGLPATAATSAAIATALNESGAFSG